MHCHPQCPSRFRSFIHANTQSLALHGTHARHETRGFPPLFLCPHVSLTVSKRTSDWRQGERHASGLAMREKSGHTHAHKTPDGQRMPDALWGNHQQDKDRQRETKGATLSSCRCCVSVSRSRSPESGVMFAQDTHPYMPVCLTRENRSHFAFMEEQSSQDHCKRTSASLLCG